MKLRLLMTRQRRAHLLVQCTFVCIGLSVNFIFCHATFNAWAQGPEVDYSKFLHTSSRHSSIACTSCHERTDNSATPRFPGHSACTTCHIGQFTTPAIPICQICHTETSGARPPLRSFPTDFKGTFNVK